MEGIGTDQGGEGGGTLKRRYNEEEEKCFTLYKNRMGKA